MKRVPISEQEKEEFLLAIKLLTEKNPNGPTRGEIFQFLFPQFDSTQEKGKNRPEYARLESMSTLLMRAGRIENKLYEHGIRGAIRFKIAPDFPLSPEAANAVAQLRKDPVFKPPALRPAGGPGEQELRHTLSRTIEALETLQETIPTILPLLLDIDRDFDRYKKVRDVLKGVKQLTEGAI